MEILQLTLIFSLTGALAIGYYRLVPPIHVLRARLPAQVTPASLVLAAAIGLAIWYVTDLGGLAFTVNRVILLLFGFLLFETFYLLLVRWVRSDVLAVTVALGGAVIVLWQYLASPSAALFNAIIVTATLGAATFLLRMDYLPTRRFLWLAVVWTAYDIVLVNFILPAAAATEPSFFLPAASVGDMSLGSGDFMFLALFTLILFRDVGIRAALWLVGAQGAGLLVTGWVLAQEVVTTAPYLVVMTPIFFLVYGHATLESRSSANRQRVT